MSYLWQRHLLDLQAQQQDMLQAELTRRQQERAYKRNFFGRTPAEEANLLAQADALNPMIANMLGINHTMSPDEQQRVLLARRLAGLRPPTTPRDVNDVRPDAELPQS